jgi:nucleoside-diphosphate-sugar epimerase
VASSAGELSLREPARHGRGHVSGDNAKARRELGFNPRLLEAGLKETLEFEMKREERASAD